MADGLDTSMRVSAPIAPIRSQVVAKLRLAIVQQRFQPGERLVERELCELVGASRGSVREALRQLETEGLVDMLPNRGPVVAKVSAKDAREIYEVRRVLEGLAARLCATVATPAHISQLHEVVGEMESAIANDRLDELLLHKDHFYEVLLDGADNSLVSKILASLHARVTTLRITTMTHPGRSANTLREIKEIVDAIEARDPDRAERACQAHVLAAAEVALGTQARVDSDGAPL